MTAPSLSTGLAVSLGKYLYAAIVNDFEAIGGSWFSHHHGNLKTASNFDSGISREVCIYVLMYVLLLRRAKSPGRQIS